MSCMCGDCMLCACDVNGVSGMLCCGDGVLRDEGISAAAAHLVGVLVVVLEWLLGVVVSVVVLSVVVPSEVLWE